MAGFEPRSFTYLVSEVTTLAIVQQPLPTSCFYKRAIPGLSFSLFSSFQYS